MLDPLRTHRRASVHTGDAETKHKVQTPPPVTAEHCCPLVITALPVGSDPVAAQHGEGVIRALVSLGKDQDSRFEAGSPEPGVSLSHPPTAGKQPWSCGQRGWPRVYEDLCFSLRGLLAALGRRSPSPGRPPSLGSTSHQAVLARTRGTEAGTQETGLAEAGGQGLPVTVPRWAWRPGQSWPPREARK